MPRRSRLNWAEVGVESRPLGRVDDTDTPVIAGCSAGPQVATGRFAAWQGEADACQAIGSTGPAPALGAAAWAAWITGARRWASLYGLTHHK